MLIFILVASGPVAAGYGPPPGITFDRFVRACVVVKTLTEAFQKSALFNSPTVIESLLTRLVFVTGSILIKTGGFK